MAHFAKLNENNKVIAVHVVSNDVATTEQAGIDFLNNLHGSDNIWKQSSYNSNLSKKFAGIGYTYDEDRDAFIYPKPYQSWTLNEETCQWEAPVAYPTDGQEYKWNEISQQWDIIE